MRAMKLLLPLLAMACYDTGSDSATQREPGGDSYTGRTVLTDAGVQRRGDDLYVTARTRGWHESAVVDFWANPGDGTGARWGSWTLTSDPDDGGGFSRDEFCDKMAGTYPGGSPGGVAASQLGSLTILIRVNFEEGCAGCLYAGDPADIAIVSDPTSDVDLSDLPGPACEVDKCQAFADPTATLKIDHEVAACLP